MKAQTIADRLWSPRQGMAEVLRQATLVLGGTLVIALSARVQVPMWPVPMTLQTLAVLLVALTFGARLATATLSVYLMQGALGLPVFAAGGGLAYLIGPTAGFLFGFLAAACAVGRLADAGWGRSPASTFASLALGSTIIYIFGAGWLAVTVGLSQAITLGVLPFLTGDLVKVVIAALVLPHVWALVSKVR